MDKERKIERLPSDERYVLISEYMSKKTRENVYLEVPMELELKSNGKAYPVDANLFYKVYTPTVSKMAEASSKHPDSLRLLDFILTNLEHGRFDALSCSKENLMYMFDWSKPKLYRVIKALKETGLINTFSISGLTYYVVDCDCIWSKAENTKWRGNKAKSGDLKGLNVYTLFKKEDIESVKLKIKKQ